MATSTLPKPSSTWSSCAKAVLQFGGGIAAAVVLVGGLSDHWHQLMAVLALGFWINNVCAAVALGVAGASLCRLFKCATFDKEGYIDDRVFRREPRTVALLIGFTVLATLIACAQPGDARSATRWLACAAVWVGLFGAWVACIPAIICGLVVRIHGTR